MAQEELLTSERLKEIINYNPDTGIFRWKKTNKSQRAGVLAGWIDVHGYRSIGIYGKTYRGCRLAWLFMTGEWPQEEIDHINGKRNDDRFINLRQVSRTTNSQNLRKPHKDNSHGLLGVMRLHKRWTAQIMVSGKRIHLGTFATPEEAHQIYIEAKRKLHEGCTI